MKINNNGKTDLEHVVNLYLKDIIDFDLNAKNYSNADKFYQKYGRDWKNHLNKGGCDEKNRI